MRVARKNDEQQEHMSENHVISLCDKTGNMVKPWADAGFICWCVDVQHSIRKTKVDGNIRFVWGDIRTWVPPVEVRRNLRILFAFPPCTHVAVSGARDFRTKNTALLRDSLEMFSACEHASNWAGVPYMIENPVGKFSDHMGKPNHTFQPWNYGENYTKLTCLWTGNGFVMPPKKTIDKPDCVDGLMIRDLSPSKERQDLRSITPVKFAEAVFDSNRDFHLAA